MAANGIIGQDEEGLWIAGATASGKSSVALELADSVGGEIVSVDSMQVYRGMDVGTAKPSRADRERVRHHLVDVAEVSEGFDAARFVELAGCALAEIRNQGRRALLCGGSGLYFKALADGLGQGPGADPRLRGELEAMPMAALLSELERLDGVTFRGVDRKNRRRLVRAVEVCRLTGRPFSEQRSVWRSGAGRGRVFALDRDPVDLRRRIEARVEHMFARGLVEETERLLALGLETNRTAMQAVGYRQTVDYLAGRRSLEETITLVKQRTWQVARRQRVWLRRHLAPVWVPVGAGEEPSATARRLLVMHDQTGRAPTPVGSRGIAG